MSAAFIKAASNAMLPLQLTPVSVGSDLFSTATITMLPCVTSGIPVSLNMKIPKGHMGLVTGRSGLALKGLQTHVGIIDSDFFGEVKVIVTNLNTTPYRIYSGDRVGQITLIQYSNVRWVQSDMFKAEAAEWSHSDFAGKHSGFGSTGR